MLVIAENLNTRNVSYMKAVEDRNEKGLSEMANKLRAAGAEVVNIQCSTDGSGDEETLPFVADSIQAVLDCGLSLDSRNVEALKRTIPLCDKPPLINYASADENEQAYEIMEVTARFRTNLVLRASRKTIPNSLEAKMQILYDLIESANAADIPNERLYADPSIVHIGHGMGQSHLVNAHHCITVLKEIVDPPVKTISWISNVSAGIPKNLRARINSFFLAYLAGAGLDASLIDVLDPEMMKAAYLIKAFKDEIIFSHGDIA
jgi:cobalamin-dependent methionine synthase I